MQKAVSFNNIATVYVKGNAYRIQFWYMSKDDATNIMNNSSLIDKMGVIYIYIHIYFIIYKNEQNDLLSEKHRRDAKYSKRLL